MSETDKYPQFQIAQPIVRYSKNPNSNQDKTQNLDVKDG
jgi:hypothetical protein